MLSSNHQAIFLSDFLIVLWPSKLEKCRLIFILRSTCDMNDNESDANIASFQYFWKSTSMIVGGQLLTNMFIG